MNRQIFYFDKSSIAKACERVKEFCAIVSNDSRFQIFSPILNVYQIPGDIDSKNSALFVESNQSSCIDYVNRIIRAHDWKSEGIEGFEEAQGGVSEESKVAPHKEAEVKPFVYFSCKTGAEADLIASTARHKFMNEIEDGKFYIQKTVSQRDKSKTYIRALSDKQKYRDAFNDFMNNFGWTAYGIQKPEMHAGNTGIEREVEIKFISLDRISEEEAASLGSLGLRKVSSNPDNIFDLDKKVREELCRRQLASNLPPMVSSCSPSWQPIRGIQPSKFESVKPPADFCRGTADEAINLALKAEQVSLNSNNMHEVLENAKQIYDFLKGVSSHFVDGQELKG